MHSLWSGGSARLARSDALHLFQLICCQEAALATSEARRQAPLRASFCSSSSSTEDVRRRCPHSSACRRGQLRTCTGFTIESLSCKPGRSGFETALAQIFWVRQQKGQHDTPPSSAHFCTIALACRRRGSAILSAGPSRRGPFSSFSSDHGALRACSIEAW